MADLSKVKDSRCFGIAWSDDAPECKICEVCNACKQRTLSGAKTVPNVKSTANPVKPAPEVEERNNEEVSVSEAAKPEKQPAKAAKSAVNYSDDMPEFKELSIEELLKLAADRGVDVSTFDKYTAPNIKRMRVIMALKETYKI